MGGNQRSLWICTGLYGIGLRLGSSLEGKAKAPYPMGLKSFNLRFSPASFQYSTIPPPLTLCFCVCTITVLEHHLIGVHILITFTSTLLWHRSLIDIYVLYSSLFWSYSVSACFFFSYIPPFWFSLGFVNPHLLLHKLDLSGKYPLRYSWDYIYIYGSSTLACPSWCRVRGQLEVRNMARKNWLYSGHQCAMSGIQPVFPGYIPDIKLAANRTSRRAG